MKNKLAHKLMVEPGTKVKLAERDPDYTGGLTKEDGRAALPKNIAKLFEMQSLLYASGEHALLVVLQAMDAGGKDGTIRHVMTGLNPQGCTVTSFKVPSVEEAKHDFLWRIHKAAPAHGEIGIFNRSHYEDVLVARVHHLVEKPVWSCRYEQINAFEKMLFENRIRMLKFFLHISKEEQLKRFQQRLQDPRKNWKASPADFEERKYWDDYMEAYEDALSRCSAPHAPWYVIPANRKWFRNLAVSQIIAEALEGLDMKYPAPSFDLSGIVLE